MVDSAGGAFYHQGWYFELRLLYLLPLRNYSSPSEWKTFQWFSFLTLSVKRFWVQICSEGVWGKSLTGIGNTVNRQTYHRQTFQWKILTRKTRRREIKVSRTYLIGKNFTDEIRSYTNSQFPYPISSFMNIKLCFAFVVTALISSISQHAKCYDIRWVHAKNYKPQSILKMTSMQKSQLWNQISIVYYNKPINHWNKKAV